MSATPTPETLTKAEALGAIEGFLDELERHYAGTGTRELPANPDLAKVLFELARRAKVTP